MGQLRSMNDLGIGTVSSRLNDAALQLIILKQLEWSLFTELEYINRSIYCQSQMGVDVRELDDLSSNMKGLFTALRKSLVDAKSGLTSEVTRTTVNVQKINSVTAELNAGNKEVEAFLSETGSNFPTSEDIPSEKSQLTHADINGVSLNQLGGTK
jgi:hypothetical protein